MFSAFNGLDIKHNKINRLPNIKLRGEDALCNAAEVGFIFGTLGFRAVGLFIIVNYYELTIINANFLNKEHKQCSVKTSYYYKCCQNGIKPDKKILIIFKAKKATNTDKSKPPILGIIRCIGFKIGAVS